jgi:stringent starvation protein B
MAERSTKPYLVRAIHEWCSDSNLTPYISVRVDESTRVPQEYVRNGEIVLNVGYDAVHKLTMGNDGIQFAARFNGVSRECSIPMSAVAGIFARETGQGMFFPPEGEAAAETSSGEESKTPPDTPSAPASGGRPKLQVIK